MEEMKVCMWRTHSILTVPHDINLFASLWLGTVGQEKKKLVHKCDQSPKE